MKAHIALVATVAVLLCGCGTYQYRIIQPQGVMQPIKDQPVQVSYAPLEYHFVKQRNRLSMQIANPTDDTIRLAGERSSVVDPVGQSRPIRELIIAPRSFAQMLLPPPTVTVAYQNWGWGPYWGWGPGWGPYNPYWGPWGPGWGWYGPPSVTYVQLRTPFDWTWNTGTARLRLSYDRKGTVFEHEFEIVREAK